MNMQKWIVTAWVFLAGLTAGISQPRESYPTWSITQGPRRVMASGAVVDIAPLMEWWTNVLQWNFMLYQVPESVEKKIKVSLAVAEDTRPLKSWFRIVGGQPETQGTAWILEAEVFDTLNRKVQAKILLRHPPEKQKMQFDELMGRYERLERRVLPDGTTDNMTWREAESKRMQVMKELNVFPSWPEYKTDCLALRTGEVYHGMMVYDCGGY